MMLSIVQAAKLLDVNPRAEVHGADHALAADLKFLVKSSNDILSELHPRLKSSFYWRDTGVAADELFQTPGHLPNLIFPQIKSIKWDKEFSGYTLRLHHGIANIICIADCEVNNFSIEMQEGGSVLFTFRVTCHPFANELAKLCEFIQQEVEIALLPPDESADLESAAA